MTVGDQRRGRGRPKGTGRIDPNAIVDAALDALARGGYPALTMRGVARTMGVSLTTLQHHFPTKDALWRAAIDAMTSTAIRSRSHLDPADLSGHISAILDQGRTRPGLLASLLTDRSAGSSERIAYLADRFAGGLAQPIDRFSELEADHVIRPVDRNALLALITIGVGSIASAAGAVRAIYGFDLDDPDDRQALAAGLSEIIGLGVLER